MEPTPHSDRALGDAPPVPERTCPGTGMVEALVERL